MITFLVGHRGSGKSSLLKRIEAYYREAGQECLCLDLDTKIAETEGASIEEIFAKKGESHFRWLEIKCAQALATNYASSPHPIFVALGAGYVGELPAGTQCLWVRRPTDPIGRIFTDRPRLDPMKTAIDEFLDRYKERQPRYRQVATEELTLPEGLDTANEFEKAFFLGALDLAQGVVTIQPEIFRNLNAWLGRRLRWNMRFELRDDLLSPEELKTAMDRIPPEKIILSLRTNPRQRNILATLKRETLWDWPLEWEIPPQLKPPILSLHERKGRSTVRQAGERLSRASRKAILKLAVEVRDFEELLEGHEWAMEDPERRAFLPRSTEGRWSWYRLFMKGKTPLTFVREGDGSASDQPYVLDWVRAVAKPESFAAILGDPVLHSRTPGEQFPFFHARQMPVLPVPLDETEWEHGGFEVLQKIGLRAAAVTSPLKVRAAKACALRSEDAERFQSVNTLIWKDRWIGHNTDFEGLKKLFELAGMTQWNGVAVWGAGGTLPLLEALLPGADFYSVRTGENRAEKPSAPPQTLVWGVGASRMSIGEWPPVEWKPSLVIDLNYGEDSPGREYAIRVGARYLSGMGMFHAQALGQRAFWEAQEKAAPQEKNPLRKTD